MTYSEVTAYTVLAYSYWASFHNAYMCLRHAHYRYQLELPYKSYRTYLTNCMGSTVSVDFFMASYFRVVAFILVREVIFVEEIFACEQLPAAGKAIV